MAFIPKRITLTLSQGFDQETSRCLQWLAARAGMDPRALAARLLAEAVAARCAEEAQAGTANEGERDVDT